jgi:Meiotically Up-regulated Gene 113 (MUG113) protein
MNKENILREIKRTAEANGGVPLGRLRFFRESGIKESDWKGKFWARWNDAVSEAGLEPNQKTGAYEEGVLIERFISLMRELGRFPVVAEIRMKVRTDASFPNDKTFGRFGSKPQFAAKILDYCQSRSGYQDVSALCAAIAKYSDARGENVDDNQTVIGFVYLIKSGRYYKIGRSNSAGRREYELAIQLPEKAKTIHTIRTDDPLGIEAYWHGRFEAKRKNGEWFDLGSADVAAFKRRKFM